MKYFSLFIVLIGFLSSYLGQTYTDTVYVGFTKTAYLIFDDKTKFDAGSQDIIVRNPDNKIIIQAAVEGFDETNLLVQCGSEYFLLLIRYKENPTKLFYNFQKNVRTTLVGSPNSNVIENSTSGTTNGKKDSVVVKPNVVMTDHATIDRINKSKATEDSIKNRYNASCLQVMGLKQQIFNRGSVLGKVTFQITNICTKEDEFYFKMKIVNSSKVSYDMDYIGWVVRDVKTKLKGQSRQDIQLIPKYIYNEVTKINGKETVEVIYIFPKFVVGTDKKLNVEAWEDNGGMNDEGGRKMQFSIFNNELLNHIQQL